MPFGQFLAKSELTKSSSTWLRKAATSGVVTLMPLPSKKALPSLLGGHHALVVDLLGRVLGVDRPPSARRRQPVPEGLGMVKKMLET